MNVCLICHQKLHKTSEERRLKEEQSSNRHWVISKRVWAVNRVREPCRTWTLLFTSHCSFISIHLCVVYQLNCRMLWLINFCCWSIHKKIKWGGKCWFTCRKSLQNSYIQLVPALSFCEEENFFLPHQTIFKTYFLMKFFLVKYFINVCCLVWQNLFISLSFPEYIVSFVCCIVKLTNGFCIDEEYQTQETSHRTNSNC